MEINLSNFYRDKAENIADFEKFFQIYGDLSDACLGIFKQIEQDGLLGDIGTFKIMPIQNIDVSPIRYNLAELLSRKSVYEALSLSDYTLLGRMILWIEGRVSLDKKIDVLTKAGNYIDLVALNNYTALWSQNSENDISKAINGKVIWFDLYNGSKKMIHGIDYAFSGQRLFIVGDYFTINESDNLTLQMKNIAIDFGWAERKFGRLFNIKYNQSISINEYSNIIQNLAKVMMGGPRIKNLRAAIEAISGTTDINIYDRYTHDVDKHVFWDLDTQDGSDGVIIGPFDYIVEINNETGLDAYRMYMLTNYLQVASPTGSKFTLLLNLYYSDAYQAYMKLSDAYAQDIMNGAADSESVVTSAAAGDVLNNPNMDINTTIELYHGYLRTDEHDDELIPV